MKSIAVSLFFLFVPLVSTVAEDWPDLFERLLSTYVQPDCVDYETWFGNADDLVALTSVTQSIGAATLEGLSRDQRLAFYLNAYNAWMLKLVFNDYPIESIKQIGLIRFQFLS